MLYGMMFKNIYYVIRQVFSKYIFQAETLNKHCTETGFCQPRVTAKLDQASLNKCNKLYQCGSKALIGTLSGTQNVSRVPKSQGSAARATQKLTRTVTMVNINLKL